MFRFTDYLKEQSNDWHIHWKRGPSQGEFKVQAQDAAKARELGTKQLSKGSAEPFRILSVSRTPSLYKQRAEPNTADELKKEIAAVEAEIRRKENSDDRYYSNGGYDRDKRHLDQLRAKLKAKG